MKKLKTTLHKICSNSFNNKFIDKKIIAGVILGITIAAGTSVIADDKTQDNTNVLGSIANFFGIKSTGSNNNTVSAINKELELEAKKCAEGANDTLGAAIKNAAKIHLEIAAVAPPVEELFDGDCFSGLMSIFDLSFAIPSLASIMAAVTQAMIKFAQKQVCRAVKQASTMISDPINKAISKINSLQGLTDTNGLINGMVGQGLDSIEQNLGNEYLAPKASETITVEANAFQLSQSSIENGANSNNNTTSSVDNSNNNINYGGQVSASLYNNMNALNNAQQVISQNLQKIISLTPLISQAQQRLNACNNSNNNGNNSSNINCSQAQNEYQSLVSQKEQLELANAQIQNSISQGAYNVTLKNGAVTQNITNFNNNNSANNHANSSSSNSSNNNSWFNLDWLTN